MDIGLLSQICFEFYAFGNTTINMANLLVFYSRTGTTKKLAQQISAQLGCEVNEIMYEGKKPSFPAAAFQATRKSTTQIKGDEQCPSNFDRLILLSPIWAGKLSTPARSYLEKYGKRINDLALIATSKSGEQPGSIESDIKMFYDGPTTARVFKSDTVNSGNIDLSWL